PSAAGALGTRMAASGPQNDADLSTSLAAAASAHCWSVFLIASAALDGPFAFANGLLIIATARTANKITGRLLLLITESPCWFGRLIVNPTYALRPPQR